MGAGFKSNAALGGVGNARVVEGDWIQVDPPLGTIALVNHVTYLTREIVPFIRKLERGDQWALWPLKPDLEQRLRAVLESRFGDLFTSGPEGFVPRFITPGREILITWEPEP